MDESREREEKERANKRDNNKKGLFLPL